MNVTYNPETEQVEWAPYRGDYGADHSSDIIEAIEELNCSKGCARSGTAAERAEFGPGGNCHILALVAVGDYGEVIHALDPRPTGPHCEARMDPPEPEPVPLPPPVGMEPLFDITKPDTAMELEMPESATDPNGVVHTVRKVEGQWTTNCGVPAVGWSRQSTQIDQMGLVVRCKECAG